MILLGTLGHRILVADYRDFGVKISAHDRRADRSSSALSAMLYGDVTDKIQCWRTCRCCSHEVEQEESPYADGIQKHRILVKRDRIPSVFGHLAPVRFENRDDLAVKKLAEDIRRKGLPRTNVDEKSKARARIVRNSGVT